MSKKNEKAEAKVQHIISLEVENFKRVKAVKLDLNGNHATIGGRNKQGKSATLDAVAAVFGGKKACPEDPIHHGEEKATIVCQTDLWTITRTFTENKTALKIQNNDGATFSSPQAMLDDVYETLTADPTAFMLMSADEQAAILRRLVGLDLTKEKAARKKVYDERTDVGRDVKRLEGAIASVEVPDDAPEAEVSIADLTAQRASMVQHNDKVAAKNRRLDELREKGRQALKQIDIKEAEIKVLQKAVDQVKEDGKALKEEIEQDGMYDMSEVDAQLADIERLNTAARARAKRTELGDDLAAAKAKQDQLTARIEEIDELMRDATEKAAYPVDGLLVTDDGVQLNGAPLKQASDAEQIEVSTAIALASKPGVRVLLVRRGSLLDEDARARLFAAADAADAQVLFEVVSGDGEGCTVVIEDGQVAG